MFSTDLFPFVFQFIIFLLEATREILIPSVGRHCNFSKAKAWVAVGTGFFHPRKTTLVLVLVLKDTSIQKGSLIV